MKLGTCVLAIMLWVSGIGSVWAGDITTKTAQVRHTLQAYEQAWSRHDPEAAAAFYYEPAMRLSHDGPKVRATREEELAFFKVFLPGIVKAGYDYSRWDHLEIHLLDSRTAIASGVVTRYRHDGSVFERQGATYGLWHTQKGWKIFLSATHAPNTALRFQVSRQNDEPEGH